MPSGRRPGIVDVAAREVAWIWRDKVALLLAVGIPLIAFALLATTFSNAVIRDLRVDVVDQDRSQTSMTFVQAISSAPGVTVASRRRLRPLEVEVGLRLGERGRALVELLGRSQQLRRAFARIYRELPQELRQLPEAELLSKEADEKVFNIIQLIYRSKNYEGVARDYEFSRRSMEEHWRAGYQDAVRTLRHPEVLQRPNSLDGVFTFNLAVHGRE